MKIRTKSRQSSRTHSRFAAKSTSLRNNFASVAKMSSLLLFVALLCNGYIYLNQKISESNRTLVKVRREADRVGREIEQQKVLLEELSSWQHIGPQCERFKLGLQLPAPDQIAGFTVLPPAMARKAAEALRRPARTAVR